MNNCYNKKAETVANVSPKIQQNKNIGDIASDLLTIKFILIWGRYAIAHKIMEIHPIANEAMPVAPYIHSLKTAVINLFDLLSAQMQTILIGVIFMKHNLFLNENKYKSLRIIIFHSFLFF